MHGTRDRDLSHPVPDCHPFYANVDLKKHLKQKTVIDSICKQRLWELLTK